MIVAVAAVAALAPAALEVMPEVMVLAVVPPLVQPLPAAGAVPALAVACEETCLCT